MLTLRETRCRRGSGGQQFLVEIDRFTIAPGEVVAITGRSGCGKSTILELLGLVLRPDHSASFLWQTRDGQRTDLAALWRREDDTTLSALRAQRIGFVLQVGGLLPYLSVDQNVCLSRRLLGLPLDEARVDNLLRVLGISHLRQRAPDQLSIGERQRVSIARALAHEPELLLVDEPTSALDPQLAEEVFDLLVETVRRSGCAAVIVTHDQRRVRALGLREIRAALVRRGDIHGAVFSG